MIKKWLKKVLFIVFYELRTDEVQSLKFVLAHKGLYGCPYVSPLIAFLKAKPGFSNLKKLMNTISIKTARLHRHAVKILGFALPTATTSFTPKKLLKIKFWNFLLSFLFLSIGQLKFLKLLELLSSHFSYQVEIVFKTPFSPYFSKE